MKNKNNTFFPALFWPIIAIVMGLLLLLVGVVNAAGTDSQVRQKAQFDRLLKQRRTISIKLATLDNKAAHATRRGDEPVTIYAEQVSLQDKLDLIELRLEIISARCGFALPPIRLVATNGSALNENELESQKQARRALERGRGRAMRRIQSQAKALLASLDFTDFLCESTK